MAERMTEQQKTPSDLVNGTLLLRIIVLTIAGFLVMLAVPPRRVSGAEFNIQTGLSLSEEYTDNLFLTTTDRQQDYMTQAVPAVKLTYKTSLWDWALDYAYFARYYSGNKITNDSTQTANLTNKTELISNTFFVALNDVYSRVSLNVARDYTQESTVVNQSDTNVVSVNPYIILKNTPSTSTVLGYQYVNTWYKDPTAIGTIEQTESVAVSTQLSSQTTFTTGVRYTQNMNNLVPFGKFDIYTGPSYTYAPNSYMFIILGNSLLDFDMTGQTREHVSQAFWNAGITYQYSTMAVSFTTALSYIPDPVEVVRRQDNYVVSLKKIAPTMTIQASGGFTEYRNAEKNYIEDTTYSLSGSVIYALSPRSTIDVGVSVEYLRDYQLASATIQDVYLNHLRYEHKALKNMTLA